jgi:hypothetical protein
MDSSSSSSSSWPVERNSMPVTRSISQAGRRFRVAQCRPAGRVLGRRHLYHCKTVPVPNLKRRSNPSRDLRIIMSHAMVECQWLESRGDGAPQAPSLRRLWDSEEQGICSFLARSAPSRWSSARLRLLPPLPTTSECQWDIGFHAQAQCYYA